jgi:hypothetical protein
MAIVKLNKLQRMSENMSQLLSNETHMPKNLYRMLSEKLQLSFPPQINDNNIRLIQPRKKTTSLWTFPPLHYKSLTIFLFPFPPTTGKNVCNRKGSVLRRQVLEPPATAAAAAAFPFLTFDCAHFPLLAVLVKMPKSQPS